MRKDKRKILTQLKREYEGMKSDLKKIANGTEKYFINIIKGEE